jgi:hypothetical protein
MDAPYYMNPTASTAFATEIAAHFYLLSANSAEYGVENLCRYHGKYCTGSLKQYSSYAECIRFNTQLPRSSSTCGVDILTGNSLTCRLKHTALTSVYPGTCCPYIGVKSPVCDDKACFRYSFYGGKVAKKTGELLSAILATPDPALLACIKASNDTVKAPGHSWTFPNICRY